MVAMRHGLVRGLSMCSRAQPQGVGSLPFGTAYHVPVVCKEVIEWLVTDPDGLYIDGTLGGGGHSAALLEALGQGGRVVGLDRDPAALETASNRLHQQIQLKRFWPGEGNFAQMREALGNCPMIDKQVRAPGPISGIADGVLLDLGVSSRQLDDRGRGFSFKDDGPLDMRMEGMQGSGFTAAELCNMLDETELRNILYRLGEEKRSTRLARAIIAARPLVTTAQLTAVVRDAVPFKDEKKTLTRVFQALRIQVNGELEALEAALDEMRCLVKEGGRVVVLSYHSLEDRRVKRTLATGNLYNKVEKDSFGNKMSPWKALTRKPIMAGEEEISLNPRARSVRMRVAERTSVH
ncbi:unnamed protein product [Chrysoparadoxa australica]